jgi:hypothetical protein
MQVLGKCQLLEAVQEKEQGLDSLGWISCYIYILFTIMFYKLRHFGWIIVKPKGKNTVTLNLPNYLKFSLGVIIM